MNRYLYPAISTMFLLVISFSSYAQTIFSGKRDVLVTNELCSPKSISLHDDQNGSSPLLSREFGKRDKLDIHGIETINPGSTLSRNFDDLQKGLIEFLLDNCVGFRIETQYTHLNHPRCGVCSTEHCFSNIHKIA